MVITQFSRLEIRRSSARLVVWSVLIVSLMGFAGAANAGEFALFGRLTLISGTTPERQYVGSDSFSTTAPTSSNMPLVIPPRMFELSGMAFRAFPAAPGVAQFVETFTDTQPSAATFQVGSGAGAFSFCPRAGNPANPACLVPASATGGRNGRVVNAPGSNQFGGTLGLLRRNVGTVSQRVATAPLQFVHRPLTVPTRVWAAGGGFSLTHTYPQGAGEITQSPVLGPDGSILTAGPVVGTAPGPGTRPATGFPFTTGMVVHSVSVPSQVTASFTGSDARTASGFGDITMVAGGTSQSLAQGNDFPVISVMAVTVPEPQFELAIVVSGMLLGALAVVRRRTLEA